MGQPRLLPGRARTERAATQPETAAAATRVLRDYHASERRRFQLVNTLLVSAAGTLLVPMAVGGWDRSIPPGLAFVGLGCLLLALVWLADFALRPLQLPTRPAPLPVPVPSAEGER